MIHIFWSNKIPTIPYLPLFYIDYFCMSPMYKMAESLPQWLFNHYQPNTTQFLVQASGFLGDSCLPIETIIRHRMSQTSQWYPCSCGLDWPRLFCETEQERVKCSWVKDETFKKWSWDWFEQEQSQAHFRGHLLHVVLTFSPLSCHYLQLSCQIT